MEIHFPSPPTDASRVLLLVPAPQISYFHAVLEGYDDLATMRTLSSTEGLVEILISPGAEGEFSDLVNALRREGLQIREAHPGGD
jgi:hypothetical protein